MSGRGVPEWGSVQNVKNRGRVRKLSLGDVRKGADKLGKRLCFFQEVSEPRKRINSRKRGKVGKSGLPK